MESSEEMQPPERDGSTVDYGDPNYWAKGFKGTPFSIVVPPYIRFLQGSVVLHQALTFLKAARHVASSGNLALASILVELENSKDSMQLGLSYEKFFASHLTITLVSEVEHFLSSAVAAALRLYPEKMGSQTIKLSELISATSKEEVIDRAAGTVMNALMYEKPLDYIERFSDIVSIDASKLKKLWPAFVELKARRDTGVHNNWVANEIYLRKIREAGISGSCAIRERLIPDFPYLHNAMESCKDLVGVIVQQLAAKWIPTAHESNSP